MSISLILLVIACILLFYTAFGGTIRANINPGWLGMAFWCLSLLLGGFGPLVLHH